MTQSSYVIARTVASAQVNSAGAARNWVSGQVNGKQASNNSEGGVLSAEEYVRAVIAAMTWLWGFMDCVETAG